MRARSQRPESVGPRQFDHHHRLAAEALIVDVRDNGGGIHPDDLALALRRADSEAATEHLARQMATLYDLGLETAALQDLRALFARATEEFEGDEGI